MSNRLLEICGIDEPERPEPEVLKVLSRTPSKIKVIDNEPVETGMQVLKTSQNVRRVLMYDTKYQGLGYNSHSDTCVFGNDEITEVIITTMRIDLEERYGVKCSKEDFKDMVIWVCHQNSFDPLLEYLDSLVDIYQPKNVKTLESLFSGPNPLVQVGRAQQYSDLLRAISVKWAVSAVVRAYSTDHPSKVDTCLVLVGTQGAYKSTILEALAGSFFSDSHLPISDKDGYQLIHSSGTWIWELGEMHSLRGKSAENTKMYLSAKTDLYRPTHARFPVRRHRRLIFTATTNDFTFLSDPTGNRRFWPVLVEKIDKDRIIAQKDRFWAEAVYLYRIIKKGQDGAKMTASESKIYKKYSTWWLEGDLATQLQTYQNVFYLDDPWIDTISQSISTRFKIQLKNVGHIQYHSTEVIGATMDNIMDDLNLPVGQRHTGYARRIADICRALHATRKQTAVTYQDGAETITKRVRLWTKE